jgi:hypothetical protein
MPCPDWDVFSAGSSSHLYWDYPPPEIFGILNCNILLNASFIIMNSATQDFAFWLSHEIKKE